MRVFLTILLVGFAVVLGFGVNKATTAILHLPLPAIVKVEREKLQAFREDWITLNDLVVSRPVGAPETLYTADASLQTVVVVLDRRKIK